MDTINFIRTYREQFFVVIEQNNTKSTKNTTIFEATKATFFYLDERDIVIGKSVYYHYEFEAEYYLA